MKKHIPNFITLCNLMAGSAALLMVFTDRPVPAVILLLAAALFDFLDGMAARMLRVTSELGKQLDSLADIISFGMVPAAFIYKIMQFQLANLPADSFWNSSWISAILLVTILIVPAFSAIRLARFNNQPAGDSEFSGLPTPAHALFWTGIYFDIIHNESLFGQEIRIGFTWIIMVVMAGMMIIPLPMLSLKFTDFKFRTNFFRYLIIFFGLLLIALLQLPGLPVLVLIYILLSLVRIVLT